MLTRVHIALKMFETTEDPAKCKIPVFVKLMGTFLRINISRFLVLQWYFLKLCESFCMKWLLNTCVTEKREPRILTEDTPFVSKCHISPYPSLLATGHVILPKHMAR